MEHATQNQQILEFLQNGIYLTQVTAFRRFDCWRLAARVHDLKKQGHDIKTWMHKDEKTGKRYAMYSLVRDGDN